ncbi:MAG: hypothetical protein LBL41_02340 [Bifidobacteriaceae bacterium]|nr:hypothetical protein [Bifidobacteriaceae bacterium]
MPKEIFSVVNVDTYQKNLTDLANKSYNTYKQAYIEISNSSVDDATKQAMQRDLFKETCLAFGNQAATLANYTWNTVYDTQIANPRIHSDAFGVMKDFDEAMSKVGTNRQLIDLRSAMLRYVRCRANDETIRYSEKAGNVFARKVRGGITCAFCTMLAGRGFIYSTRAKAGAFNSYHRGCDCLVISRKDAKTKFKDYDPEYYRKIAERDGEWVDVTRTLPDGTEKTVPWFKFKKGSEAQIAYQAKQNAQRAEAREAVKAESAKETARVKAEAEKATRIAQQAEAKAAKALKVLKAKAKEEIKIKELLKIKPANVIDNTGGKAWAGINDDERKFYIEAVKIMPDVKIEIIYNDPTKRTDDFIMGGVKYELKQPGVGKDSKGNLDTLTNAIGSATKKNKRNVMLDLTYIKMSRKELDDGFRGLLKSPHYGKKLDSLGIMLNGVIEWLK